MASLIMEAPAATATTAAAACVTTASGTAAATDVSTATAAALPSKNALPLSNRSSYYYAHNTHERGTVGGVVQAASFAPRKLTTEEEIKMVEASACVKASIDDKLSDWNTGYHWEERDFATWGNKRLEQLLLELSIDIGKGGKRGGVKAIRVETKGECFSNIRKGRRICCYDFDSVIIHWEGTAKDKASDIFAKGTATLVDASNTAGPCEWDSLTIECHGNNPQRNIESPEEMDRIIRKVTLIEKTCKKFLPGAIKKQFTAFDAELAEK